VALPSKVPVGDGDGEPGVVGLVWAACGVSGLCMLGRAASRDLGHGMTMFCARGEKILFCLGWR
jgi:hypothetical protein